MSLKIFLSTVSDEFRTYRDALRSDLTRHNVEVKVQEDFKDLGGDTLDKLDVYITHCDAVIHLVGNMTGSDPGDLASRALREKYPDLGERLPPLDEALKNGIGISYTQWEAWLALYHGKRLFIAKASDDAERGPNYTPTSASCAAQSAHMARLKKIERYPGCTFTSPADLAKSIAYTAILDLLVTAYAEEAARERDVAVGFIHELAKGVASDRTLDLEGMKLAVRNAIDIYENEIIGGQAQTNIDVIVDEALARARKLVDAGKSGLARAALRKAAEAMRSEEDERRERYVAGITVLYNRERDIALAAYDGVAAAQAIIALVEAIHGTNTAMVTKFLNSEAKTLNYHGGDCGSNVHLIALIEVARKLVTIASSGDERRLAHHNLGAALWSLGWREGGTGRLEEAAAAFREALKDGRTRKRVPLMWALTQNNLGTALAGLGQRESGTAKLDEAVAAYREALKEFKRERTPLLWAMTQNNLGAALLRLGERESGTGRLEEAVAVFREALKERTREHVPLEWAMTQNNLGAALWSLGERESGTGRLEAAAAAFREALKERTRERVPLEWALSQSNLGNALSTLGERESSAAKLEEAVAAYREALKEQTRERVPFDWTTTQNNLGNALRSIGERESGTAKLAEAVAPNGEALEIADARSKFTVGHR